MAPYAPYQEAKIEDPFSDITADMTGIVAVITGGAGGLGHEAAKKLAEKNAFVYILDKNDPLPVNRLDPERVTYFPGDAANPLAYNKMIAAIKEKHGYVNILLCAAAIAGDAAKGSVPEFDKNKFLNIMGLNAGGPMLAVSLLMDLLQAAEQCAVLFCGSVLEDDTVPTDILYYRLSKMLLLPMIRTIQTELKIPAYSIRYTTIGTGMADEQDGAYKWAKLNKRERALTPEEAANLAIRAYLQQPCGEEIRGDDGSSDAWTALRMSRRKS